MSKRPRRSVHRGMTPEKKALRNILDKYCCDRIHKSEHCADCPLNGHSICIMDEWWEEQSANAIRKILIEVVV